MDIPGRKRRLLPLAALYGVAAHVVALVLFLPHARESIGFGFGTARSAGAWRVTVLAAGAPAARVLEPGDALLAFQGDARVERTGLVGRGRELRAGTPVRLRIRRGASGAAEGVEREVTFLPSVRARTRGEILYLAIVFLTSVAFLATSFLIVARRDGRGVGDDVALLGAAGLYLSAFTIVRNVTGAVWGSLSDAEAVLYVLFAPLVSPFHLSILISFFVRFPERLGNVRVRAWLERAALVSGLVIWLGCEVRGLLAPVRSEPVADFYARTAPIWASFWSLIGPANLVLFLALAVLVYRNLRLTTDPDGARRLRWVAGGAFVTIAPWIALFSADLLGWLSPDGRDALNRIANLALVAVPVTTGTAIVKHRLFDLNVAVRRGLQYLLARHVLQALLAVPLAGLALVVYRSRNRTLEELLFESQRWVYVLAVAALVLLLRRRLLLWLDRRFFRAAYDREQVLVGLSERLASLDSLEEISREVHRSLEAALHPKALMVLERDAARTSAVVAYSSDGVPASPPAAALDDLLQRLEGASGALDLPLPGGDWLAARGAVLAVPMALPEGRLAGLLVLGEKRSEEPYSSSDRTLLLAVARQMAIVRENARLRESVRREKRLSQDLLSRYDGDGNLVRECPRCSRAFDGSAPRCPDDGGPLSVLLPVPRLVDGRYRLERRIGRGGMGAVYLATDERLGREVAVKVVIAPLFQGEAGVRRFEREARAAARLVHPNVVAVHDYGTFEPSGAYLVMEMVRGVTLRGRLRDRGAVAPAEAATWFGQLLDGVAAAHAAGIVHRDLKPENVLLTTDQEGRTLVKVLDFGLAKVTLLELTAEESLTIPGTAVGTIGYMSPEQVAGDEVDARSDVFALGVLLYETLTGEVAFRGKTWREVMAATHRDRVTLLEAGGTPDPHLAALDALLSRCLAKRPEERLASVSALKAELLPLLPLVPPLRGAGPSSDDRPTVAVPSG